jgi:hypothetical protein
VVDDGVVHHKDALGSRTRGFGDLDVGRRVRDLVDEHIDRRIRSLIERPDVIHRTERRIDGRDVRHEACDLSARAQVREQASDVIGRSGRRGWKQCDEAELHAF